MRSETYPPSLAYVRVSRTGKPGRARLLIAQEGWEEIAAYVANWLLNEQQVERNEEQIQHSI